MQNKLIAGKTNRRQFTTIYVNSEFTVGQINLTPTILSPTIV